MQKSEKFFEKNLFLMTTMYNSKHAIDEYLVYLKLKILRLKVMLYLVMVG